MANHYLIVLNGINNDGRKLRNSFLGVRMSTNDCSSSAHEIIKGSTNMAGNLAKCYTVHIYRIEMRNSQGFISITMGCVVDTARVNRTHCGCSRVNHKSQ